MIFFLGISSSKLHDISNQIQNKRKVSRIFNHINRNTMNDHGNSVNTEI